MDLVRQACGRTLKLAAVEQERTYRNLPDGLPTTRWNAREIFAATVAAGYWGKEQFPVHVIAPRETPIAWDGEQPYEFGTPARLPAIRVRALFSSEPLAAPAQRSQAVVLWWQEDWLDPVDPEVLEVLRTFTWEEVALDDEIER